jgi:hypothetical protein
VVVREKLATWETETADVGARGCRIAMRRPVAQGTLLQLRFEREDGSEPLEAVGQVAWTRGGDQQEAGIAFVSTPRSRTSGPNWIDELAAAQLRAAIRDGAAPGAALADAVLRLGVPPREPLPAPELAIAKVAEREGRLAEASDGRETLAALAALLEEGTVTLGRSGADAKTWKRVLSSAPAAARPATGAPPAAARLPAPPVTPRPPEPAREAIVPPPPRLAYTPPPVAPRPAAPAPAPVPDGAAPERASPLAPPTPLADARASGLAALIAESLL